MNTDIIQIISWFICTDTTQVISQCMETDIIQVISRNIHTLHKSSPGSYIEGFQPEWYILTIYHYNDIPFWSETLDIHTLSKSSTESHMQTLPQSSPVIRVHTDITQVIPLVYANRCSKVISWVTQTLLSFHTKMTNPISRDIDSEIAYIISRDRSKDNNHQVIAGDIPSAAA